MKSLNSIFLWCFLFFTLGACASTSSKTGNNLGKVLSKSVLSTEREIELSIKEQLKQFGVTTILTGSNTYSYCEIWSDCSSNTPISLAHYEIELNNGDIMSLYSDHGRFSVGDCVSIFEENGVNKMLLARSCRGFK